MGKQVPSLYLGTGAGLSFEVVENLRGFGKKEALSLSERASSEKDVRFFLLGNTDRAQVAHVFHVFHLGLTTFLVDSVPFLEKFLP